MNKLLTILNSFGMIVSTSATVISCTSENENENNIKISNAEFEKLLKTPLVDFFENYGNKEENWIVGYKYDENKKEWNKIPNKYIDILDSDNLYNYFLNSIDVFSNSNIASENEEKEVEKIIGEDHWYSTFIIQKMFSSEKKALWKLKK